MLVIHPDECIDCTLCEPECPIEAIVSEDEVPAGQEKLPGAECRAVAAMARHHGSGNAARGRRRLA